MIDFSQGMRKKFSSSCCISKIPEKWTVGKPPSHPVIVGKYCCKLSNTSHWYGCWGRCESPVVHPVKPCVNKLRTFPIRIFGTTFCGINPWNCWYIALHDFVCSARSIPSWNKAVSLCLWAHPLSKTQAWAESRPFWVRFPYFSPPLGRWPPRWVGRYNIAQLLTPPRRWAPTSYKWSHNPYKCP